MILPEHMSVKDRNRRLYETLKDMGLHTEVILSDEYPDTIDSILVSACRPGVEVVTLKQARQLIAAELAAETSIRLPMERDEVGECIGTTECDRLNVVDFPTVV